MAATPITDLLQLPMAERVALDVELCAELDRRWAAHLQNPTAAISWEQVCGQLGLGPSAADIDGA